MFKQISLLIAIILLFTACSKKTLPDAQGKWVLVERQTSLSSETEYYHASDLLEVYEITHNMIISHSKKDGDVDTMPYTIVDGKAINNSIMSKSTFEVKKLTKDTLILFTSFEMGMQLTATEKFVPYHGTLPPKE